MHPVVSHLLARKNQTVPISDGRKISLILFGGIMTGVRGTGALAGLIDLGLADAFDEIYSVSAGFPNASYFLSHNKHGSSIYYDHLCGKEFINFLRPWKLVDIDYLVNIMDTEVPLDYQKISDHPTALYVKLLNLETKQYEHVKVNGLPPAHIRSIMKAALSIPFLNPGSVTIEGKIYKDGGMEPDGERDDIEYVFNHTHPTDIVVIFNTSYQFETVKDLPVLKSDRVLTILPSKNSTVGKFCSDSKKLKAEVENMSNLVKKTFEA